MSLRTRHRIAILCASLRGLEVLRRVATLEPEAELLVVSFRETPGEPLFFESIRDFAQQGGHPFLEARRLDEHGWNRLTGGRPVDLMLVVSWRYLVPRSVYVQPVNGTFVLHDSLLPEFRGFAPTVWAIARGRDHTGASLFRMTDVVDGGPVVARRRVSIGSRDTIGDVMPWVTSAYLDLLTEHLPALLAGTAGGTPQDERLASTMRRRTAADSRIDWTSSAKTVFDLIRAISPPYSGARTELAGRELIVWRASSWRMGTVDDGSSPGTVRHVTEHGECVVVTGRGQVTLHETQWADESAAGTPGLMLTAGDCLGCPVKEQV